MKETQRPVLSYRQGPGIELKCTIDLSKLFPDAENRRRFQNHYRNFCNSQPTICNIIQELKSSLTYQSEQLIPTKRDSRPPVLFVFGNPAIHSIKNGMFFSSEGKNGREHRFWKSILPKAGVEGLNFNGEEDERNKQRLRALLDLNYKASIRIGLCVFISFPSAASGEYSGIQGVKKLFGSKAIAELLKHEKERVLSVIKKFVTNDGAVFTFQSDAWNGLKRAQNSVYKIKRAKSKQLAGEVDGLPGIRLFGLPPTRLSGPTGTALEHFLLKIG